MSKQFDLLNKFYENKATENEKRQLAKLLHYQELWEEDFDRIWECSFGNIPEQADKRIMRTLFRTIHPGQTVSLRLFLRVASCVAVVAAIALSLFFWHENRLLTRYADMTVEVGKGQKSEVILPDGTKVYLNADSKLCYGKTFNGRQRTVELIGEAFFEVRKDPRSPFTVKANNVQVRALGTAFNIQAYPDSDKVIAYLQNGSVSVTASDRSLKLSPGEVAIYNLTHTTLEKIKSQHDKFYTAWLDGEMVFEDEPLSGIIKLLERTYNVTFEIKDENLLSLTYTGTLKNSSLQSALDALQFTSCVSYKKGPDCIELYSN